MLTIQFISWLMMFTPQETIPIPTDIRVWGGVSLAAVFRFGLVPLLTALKILTDRNKKTVGYFLIGLGAVAGVVYSVGTGNIDEPLQIIINLAAGGLSGAGAVGLHSSHKNFQEWRHERKK